MLEDQAASDIELPQTILGLIVSFLWLLYAVTVQNTFMIVSKLLSNSHCNQLLFLTYFVGAEFFVYSVMWYANYDRFDVCG